jgi:C-terminal processing protease CtpA/Prc
MGKWTVGVVGAVLMCALTGQVATGSDSATTQQLDQIQRAIQQANKLRAGDHPDAGYLRQAAQLLQQTLTKLDHPDLEDLANGNAYLRSQRAEAWRDIAAVYALQGNKLAALDTLDAAQAEEWKPDEADNMRKDAAFAALQNEPRFKAILANLDAARERWHASTLAVPYAPQLTEAQRIAGLSLFWSEVKYNFVHFDRVPQLNWDQVYLDFLPKVIAAKDTRDYYAVLMQLAPLLQDAHTNIYPPSALRGHFYARPPLGTELIDDHVLITDVLSDELSRDGLAVGDEILAVDGIEVHRYAHERIAPQESSETPQDANVRMYTYGLLSGDKDTSVRLTLRDGNGQTRDVTIRRNNYPDRRQRPDAVFQMLPNGIAYLPIDEFENDDGVKALEQHLPDILQAKGLILDVRQNGGGSSDYGLQILSYLGDKSVPTEGSRELHVSPVSRSDGDLTLEWQKLTDSGKLFDLPRSQHFHGPVAVLIGPETFSAAEDFVVSFKAMKRGLVIGQTTAGSTGQPLMFDMPGGGSARICAKRDTYPDGSEFVGSGIAPDVAVVPTVQDVRAHRDPVVERAAELLLTRDAVTASR